MLRMGKGMRRKNLWARSYEKHQKIKETKLLLCHTIKRSAARRNYNQRTMAFYMGTSASNASLVDNLKIEKLSVNQLFQYLTNLEPNFELLISI